MIKRERRARDKVSSCAECVTDGVSDGRLSQGEHGETGCQC